MKLTADLTDAPDGGINVALDITFAKGELPERMKQIQEVFGKAAPFRSAGVLPAGASGADPAGTSGA